MDIGQIDKSEGEDEDDNAVQQRRPHDRSNQKHKQVSDNERKPFNRRTANSSPSAPRQSTPRDKKLGNDETKPGTGKKKRLICYRCGGKGHPARLCPSPDDCQDADEVGTEKSSDADSDLFGQDWGDDTIMTINSVTERNDRFVVEVNCWRSLTPVRLTMCFQSQCVPSISWRQLPSRKAELVIKEQKDHTSSTMGSDVFESRQALEAILTPPGKSRMCASR